MLCDTHDRAMVVDNPSLHSNHVEYRNVREVASEQWLYPIAVVFGVEHEYHVLRFCNR